MHRQCDVTPDPNINIEQTWKARRLKKNTFNAVKYDFQKDPLAKIGFGNFELFPLPTL